MKTVRIVAAAYFDVPDDWGYECGHDGQTIGLVKPDGTVIKPLVCLEVQDSDYNILCTDKHFKEHGIECIEYCDETGVE